MNQLKNAGGHFLSLLTKEKWLFLGDSRFVQIAEQIDAIQSAVRSQISFHVNSI